MTLTKTVLTVQEVYGHARRAGFPAVTARVMVAIAQRESGLRPNARCKNCIPRPEGGFYSEDSIGLWQINMLGAFGDRRLKEFGIPNRETLLRPDAAARAAFKIWAGRDANLDIAWAINRDKPIPFRTRFLKLLAALPPVDEMERAYQGKS